MTSVTPTRLHVSIDLGGRAHPVGVAHVNERRGVPSVVFEYEPDYARDPRAYALSPDLDLSSGRHSVTSLPGSFADSAPDRWGRNLIAKRHRASARAEGRSPGIRETDYLIGVSDVTRQGALRFALSGDGPFLGQESDIPKLVELPRLLHAADDVATDGEDDLAAVKLLLDAGTGSLGGARPKASVRDGERLLIAKFPHPGDEWDVMAWEMTALDLAERSGISVPERRLIDLAGRHVLLLDRFDRHEGERVGYISAMTLLQRRDGERADYLEIAEALAEHGSSVSDDLAELWRRIAFSVVINNVDDHLRNHGFLRQGSGWRLAPAFDLNPEPAQGAGRATSIGFVETAVEAQGALMASAADFGLSDDRAHAIWTDVLAGTSAWRQVATVHGISDSACDRFAPVMDRFTARR